MKAQNHENDRIVLNQPRISANDADDKMGAIESNVVYVNDANMFELSEDVS